MSASRFVARNFDILFANSVKEINEQPDFICSPRGQKVKENIASTLVLLNPRARLLNNTARNTNYGFGVGEFLWYWTGQNDLEMMLYYNKRMKDFSDNGVTLNSAYGWRLKKETYITKCDKLPEHPFEPHFTAKSQWEFTKDVLLADPDSRRAIMLIAATPDFARASGEGSKDVPCTLSLQFFIRDGKLHLHAHMRSNDVFWGLTYDLFSFTLFQECMLGQLRLAGMKNLELGNYYHTAGSLHIYERHFEDAQRVVNTYVSNDFVEAAPMEPLDLQELSWLIEDEKLLRTGKVAEIGTDRYSGGVRWMAEQLQAHRRKRDAERGQQVGPGNGDRTEVVRPDAGAR